MGEAERRGRVGEKQREEEVLGRRRTRRGVGEKEEKRRCWGEGGKEEVLERRRKSKKQSEREMIVTENKSVI